MEEKTEKIAEPAVCAREKCEMKIDRSEYPKLYIAVSRMRTAYKALMTLSQEESQLVCRHALVMMANMKETKVPIREAGGEIAMSFDNAGHRKTIYHDQESRYEIAGNANDDTFMVSLPNGTRVPNRIEGKYYSKLG